jgi:hypothetical protein
VSTLLYATLTNKRDDAKPDTSTSTQPPGVGNYVDALAALVPAEVLTAHGVLLTFTTMTDSRGLTTVTEVPTLRGAFFALIALSMVLYAAARWKNWDRLDYLRILRRLEHAAACNRLRRSFAGAGLGAARRDRHHRRHPVGPGG